MITSVICSFACTDKKVREMPNRIFSLADDPPEMTNLADLDQYQAKVQELLGQLLQLQTEMGDELDLTVFFTF